VLNGILLIQKQGSVEMWIEFVENYPILSAILQFAVLGTIGEWLGTAVRKGRFVSYSPIIIIEKITIWSIIGVMLKYAFVGFGGFVDALVDERMLPGMFQPFFLSLFMNLLFGPVQITFHRFMGNYFKKVKNWRGIKGALLTIIWFWIPAHTITFMLPKVWQITLAAFWSSFLGIIMGFFNKKKKQPKKRF